MKYISLTICALLLSLNLLAQNDIYHVEPPNWWYGMNNPVVEIMVHGNSIGDMNVEISNKNILIKEQVSENSNYLFLLLDVSKISKETNFNIKLKKGKRKISIPYSLNTRRSSKDQAKRLIAADAIYLITPDRFRNGNPKNDDISRYKERPNRSDEYGRHGGDLEGIIQSLDYIQDIGFNTVWLNPVVENDMKSQSYHGYATTDYYNIDKRFGGNEQYETLRDELQSKNMFLIMDMIANHCGSYHWWMDDLPFDDWLNNQEEYISNPDSFNIYSNHRKTTIRDPYTNKADRNGMIHGWFVQTMPDLNQRNTQMSRYIIQNSIWWVEKMNLAGIRQDTYSYPEEQFLSDWSCALMNEYPKLFIVGEEWTDNPLIAAYWQKKNDNKPTLSSESSCLPSVMDFPLLMVVNKGMKAEETWNTGFSKLYEHMVNDRLYPNPEDLVIFPDNHDMSRIYTQLDEDFDLWKMSMIYYATMRGIPQIYYGTEVIMNNRESESHGVIRSEMQGGWSDHTKSYFTDSNLSGKEIEAKSFMTRLYNWRATAKPVHSGTLKHYIPEDKVYVYFREVEQEKVMVILNKNVNDYNLDLTRFKSELESYDMVSNVLANSEMKLNTTILLKAKTSYILHFK